MTLERDAQDPPAGTTEEHRIGALVLASASVSHQGYLKIRRGARGWRAMVYSPWPRAGGERHPHLSATGETLRQALERIFQRVRLEHARGAQGAAPADPPPEPGREA